MPHVLSIAVVAILWSFLYNPSFGIINMLLERLSLSSWTRIWLGDKKIIMGAVTVPLVWINVGFYMVLFYSAMSNISIDIYESADMDGAGELHKFFFITIPSIWETIRSSLVFFVIMAFNYSFELVYVMTKGGPNRASELLSTYQYEIAFKNSDYGYSSAVGLLIFGITATAVFLVLNITRQGKD
jgi:N-acetylglucosamine transport system permease protein